MQNEDCNVSGDRTSPRTFDAEASECSVPFIEGDTAARDDVRRITIADVGDGLTYIPSRLPYDATLKARARHLRNNQTRAEKKLWYQFLSPHSESFVRQKIINHYIVDFYCAKHCLVIEVDGDSHCGLENQKYDQLRTDVLQTYGLRVLRFDNNAVYNHFEYVCLDIEKYLR